VSPFDCAKRYFAAVARHEAALAALDAAEERYDAARAGRVRAGEALDSARVELFYARGALPEELRKDAP
jgi:hypothetical protein